MNDAAGQEHPQKGKDREKDFQVEVLRIQMLQARKVAFYSAYYTVGAAFEIFSITLILTAVLLDRPLSAYWLALMAIYLGTGVGFIAFGVLGFGKLKRIEGEELRILRERFVE